MFHVKHFRALFAVKPFAQISPGPAGRLPGCQLAEILVMVKTFTRLIVALV
jgi:hypothetical protein